MVNQAEKRKYPRFNFLVDVSFSREKASAANLTITRNVSAGGVCFIAYEPLNENEIISLSLFLPDKQKVEVRGRVAWVKEFVVGDTPQSRGYDVGLEYIDLSEETRGIINQFVFSLPGQ